ncbi:3-isopropylmalate dehydrogenase [Spirochaetia bacterium]|nr:3-isopropylmalate dehydrogenase [Spirochaetia bacterium]
MRIYNIAGLPGDGVGPEVFHEVLRVLEVSQKIRSYKLAIENYNVGVAQYIKTGSAITDDVYHSCETADAILMGAIGQPKAGPLTLDKNGTEVSGHVMFRLRFGLDLFAGVRPIKLYPGVPSALANHSAIDFVVLRESCEGLFASYNGGICCRDDVAIDTQVITRKGSEKISRYAFELALSRNGRVSDGKKMVTCADKGNVFRSFAFLRKIFAETAREYEGRVAAENLMIDALALLLVQNPEFFDVIMFENMHGDIMSDMAAAFVGGMGMAPSGDIGLEHAMFQPAHGTAPSIVGKSIVNPTAMILSARMMLEWLGHRNNDDALLTTAKDIESAVVKTFEHNIRTRDIGGTSSTVEFVDEVIRQLKACA